MSTTAAAAKIELAFVMPGVGVEPRGAEAFVVELCTALSREPDFGITLYCRRPAAEAPFRQVAIAALARDRRWLQRTYGATRLGRKVADTLYLDPLNVEWATAALAAWPSLWRGGYDLVVMEGGLVGARLCRLLRRLKGTPFVDIAHGVSPKWERAFARQKPDRVVTFTRTFAAELGAAVPDARIEVIPHGVDLDLFAPGGERAALALEPPIVLVAGAVDEHKRIELAVRATARLGRGSLLVLGDGERGPAVDALAERLLGPGRYLRRVVPRAEMPSHYRAADVMTLPSRSESFGLVYLEAMACGLPCVAPDDGVRREVIAEAGTYCDPHDLAAYAAAITQALAGDHASRARPRAEQFPFAATAARYAEVFRTLTAAPPTAEAP